MPPTSDVDSANLEFRGDCSSGRAGWRGHGKQEMPASQGRKFERLISPVHSLVLARVRSS